MPSVNSLRKVLKTFFSDCPILSAISARVNPSLEFSSVETTRSWSFPMATTHRLFICKSFSILKKFRPDIDVDSAGTHAAIPISDEAKEYLARENAVDHLKEKPESLDKKRIDKYNLIIAMKQEHRLESMSRM
jgi:hypothetical protein